MEKSSAKFFTWMDSRWCEVDANTGAIHSKRYKARFAYVRRGRLHVACYSSVLRGLRALAAGKPTTVHDGPQLSQRSVESLEREQQAPVDVGAGCRHCQLHHYGCQTSNKNNNVVERRNVETNNGMKAFGKADAGTQVEAFWHQTIEPPITLTTKPPVTLTLKKYKSGPKSKWKVRQSAGSAAPRQITEKRMEIHEDSTQFDSIVDVHRSPVKTPTTNHVQATEKTVKVKLTPLKNIKKISEESKRKLTVFRKLRLKHNEKTIVEDHVAVQSESAVSVNKNPKESNDKNEELAKVQIPSKGTENVSEDNKIKTKKNNVSIEKTPEMSSKEDSGKDAANERYYSMPILVDNDEIPARKIQNVSKNDKTGMIHRKKSVTSVEEDSSGDSEMSAPADKALNKNSVSESKHSSTKRANESKTPGKDTKKRIPDIMADMKQENIQESRLRKRHRTPPKSVGILSEEEQVAPKRNLRSLSLNRSRAVIDSSANSISQPNSNKSAGNVAQEKTSGKSHLDKTESVPQTKRPRTRMPTQYISESSSNCSLDFFLSDRRDKVSRKPEESVPKTKSTHNRKECNKRRGSGSSSSTNQYKQLVIEHKDVGVLRRFLMKTNETFDIVKYDTDEEYRRSIFYLINPLVSVERHKDIDGVLQTRDGPAKDYFTAQLGLRSVSEVSSQARQSLRLNKPVDDSDSSVSNQENINRRVTRKEARAKERTPLNKTCGLGDSNERRRELDKDNQSEENDFGKKKSFMKKLRKAPTPNRVDSAKEYSSTEDHAIVAWVSNGSRAKQVNGNRVWRDLELDYPQIMGKVRTWQSLRNRYLRSILPALGRLALPPSQVARLRAAAATAKLKRSRHWRRNSMFEHPERGAASRRPRPPSETEDEPSAKPSSGEEPPSKRARTSPRTVHPVKTSTPRYSEILRQFQSRRRPSSGRSSSPERAPPSTPQREGKSRRLFNPNRML